MKEIFPGVFKDGSLLLTLNLIKGKKVYDEKLIVKGKEEFRTWAAHKSKLGAVIKNGLRKMPISPGSIVLYLGSASGTTVSHVSDIVGEDGIVFGVDLAPNVMRKFVELSNVRKNIFPVLADANKPEDYQEILADFEIDVLFQDVAQKNQAEILVKNAKLFLKSGRYAMISIKARSIDSAVSPKKIFEEQIAILEDEFDVIEKIKLDPYEKDHVVLLLKKK